MICAFLSNHITLPNFCYNSIWKSIEPFKLKEKCLWHDEKLTDHGEEVRVVHRAVPVFALVQVGPVQDSGHHEAKVGSKCVDGHGASSIPGLKTH